MPVGRSDIPAREIFRKLRRLDARIREGKGSHYIVKLDEYTSTFPLKSGRRVKWVYLKQIKRQLRISDEEWDNA